MKSLNDLFEDFVYEHEMLECLNLGNFTVKYKDGHEEIFYVDVRNPDNRSSHFHIYKQPGKFFFKNFNKNYFHTCVSIEKPEYVNHGFKLGKFTEEEKYEFNKFMSTGNELIHDFTPWEFGKELWDFNSTNHETEDDTTIPDYTKLQ